MPDERSRLVYSTEQIIPRPGNHREKKPNEKAFRTSARPAQQKVTVRLDRQGRGGKSVTVIEGLQMSQKDKGALLKQLKVRLGTGGTLKDTSVEMQGDHRHALMAALEEMGYTPKRSGG
jgi:translation initiation factor 1